MLLAMPTLLAMAHSFDARSSPVRQQRALDQRRSVSREVGLSRNAARPARRLYTLLLHRSLLLNEPGWCCRFLLCRRHRRTTCVGQSRHMPPSSFAPRLTWLPVVCLVQSPVSKAFHRLPDCRQSHRACVTPEHSISKAHLCPLSASTPNTLHSHDAAN